MRPNVTAGARRDILLILTASRTQFGQAAQKRYRVLLEQAIMDVADNPNRPGVTSPPDLPHGLKLYHTRHARSRLPSAERVGRPRHFVVFRLVNEGIEILRVLHDAMDLPSHLSLD